MTTSGNTTGGHFLLVSRTESFFDNYYYLRLSMNPFALELIHYQNNDKFPERLTALVEKIYAEIDSKKYKSNKELLSKSEHAPAIEKLIRERFNLNVTFDKEFSEYYMAAVIPFMSDYLSASSSLNNLGPKVLSDLFSGINIYKHYQQIEKERESYFARIHNRKGFVDKKHARVGGYLADVKHYLLINFFTLKQEDETPAEVTAIIVHEIGHAFSGLETHYRLQTTNSTIADVLDNINRNKGDKALYTFKKKFDEKDLEKASLDNSKEITDFYGKLANAYLGELNSQLINNKYDETNFENMADSFAVRFNLGRDLFTGLHKLHTKYGMVTQKTSFFYWSILIIEFFVLTINLILLGPATMGIVAMILLAFTNLPNGHMTYDHPVDRYNRIKNGIVNNLKNEKLPTKVVKDLLDQFFLIDGVMKNSTEFKGIVDRTFGSLDFVNKTDNYYIRLQQTIENSLNNILFVKSAQLRIS